MRTACIPRRPYDDVLQAKEATNRVKDQLVAAASSAELVQVRRITSEQVCGNIARLVISAAPVGPRLVEQSHPFRVSPQCCWVGRLREPFSAVTASQSGSRQRQKAQAWL